MGSGGRRRYMLDSDWLEFVTCDELLDFNWLKVCHIMEKFVTCDELKWVCHLQSHIFAPFYLNFL